MRISGIGIDVVEVARIARAIARHGEPFLAKTFTCAERGYCESRKDPAIHFAARFAAKEAVAKALGTGIGANAGLRDIEVIHDANGAPQIRLAGAAGDFAKQHGITEVQISLSHTREYAAANAIALADAASSA
jgi:holo-[acyl-carrier protein] synthase